MRTKITLLSLAIGSALASQAAMAGYGDRQKLTEADVMAAQQAWGEALLQISRDYAENGIEHARKTAEATLNSAYAFNHSTVLFNPTLTSGETTFRMTHDGALAYFVGGCENYPDSGFALKGWESFDIQNAGMLINGDMAISMGHVTLTNGDGEVTKVDKTWGFQRFDDGDLRIVLHHSSLPFMGS